MMIAALKKGMHFVKPPTITTFNNSLWPETFERCTNKNVELVVLIDMKSEDTHGLLKYYEARFKVITQVYQLLRFDFLMVESFLAHYG